MEVTKTLKPGVRGTARLLCRYGERLVCVNYRFDASYKTNVTAVELVVDARDAPEGYSRMYPHRPESKQRILVRVGFDETEMRAWVNDAHGRWDPARRGWVLPFQR